jgi:hypothetical protein
MVGVIAGSLGVAINAVCYVSFGHLWYNLAAGIFCGCLAIASAIQAS